VRDRTRSILVFAGALVLAGGALLLFLQREDWNWARRPVAWVLERATGRAVELNGDLRVDLGRVTTVSALDVRFDNADWGLADDLFAARRVTLALRPWPLLVGRVRLERLGLDEAVVALERRVDGVGNWDLAPGAEGGDSELRLPHSVEVRGADLTLADPARPRGFALRVDALESRTQGDAVALNGSGTYQRQPFRVTGTRPAAFAPDESAVPVVAEATVGKASASVDGTVDRGGGADVALRLAAPSLDALWTLIGFPLPRSPAFSVDGRLRWEGRSVRLDDFSARLGKSDLAGDLAVRLPAGERMHIEADVRSKAIDLDDVEGFYGRDPEEESPATTATDPAASVFPDLAFDFAKLRAADARVRFAAERVQGKTALDDVRMEATLERGILRLSPLELGMSDGDLAARGVFDASTAEASLDAELVIRNVDLGRLLARLEVDQPAAGTFGGRFGIKTRGNSLGAMARNLDGELGVVLRRGRLGDPLLELVALHLGDYLFTRLGGRQDIDPIDCLVGVFDARDGVLAARTLLLDTEHVRIEGEGTIDLGKEHIDLVLRQHSKDLAIGALRTPIEIAGPLRTRRARLVPGPLLARGGAAVALGLVHPAAALLALVDLGSDDRPDACAEALAQYRPIAGSVAPPRRPGERRGSRP
jgi:uncharacterized protein involved in outer membrane biogenesis